MTYFLVSTDPYLEARRPTPKVGSVVIFCGDPAWHGLGELSSRTLERCS
jgi:hypothetical protein